MAHIKNKENIIIIFSLVLLIIVVNICEPIKNIYFLFYAGTIIIAIEWLSTQKKITTYKLIEYLIWISMFLIPRFSLPNFFTNNINILKYEAYILIGLLLMELKFSYVLMVKLIAFIGYIHVIATYLFLIIPSTVYSDFALNVFGQFPQGTEMGTKGYTAGICSHYSANALYISVVIFALWTLYITKNIEKRKGLILEILAFGALLLTEKRGHLVFVILTIFLNYYSLNKKRFSKIFNRIFIAILILFPVLFIGILSSSRFFSVFYRFSGIFSGRDISTGRFTLWRKALSLFIQNPFTGIGWQQFESVAHVYFNTHNTYLQILCETGIFGGIIYVIALLVSFSYINQVIKMNIYKEIDNSAICGAFFSKCVQIFFILYGFTGNVLYDNTFFFYMLALGIGLSVFTHKKVL